MIKMTNKSFFASVNWAAIVIMLMLLAGCGKNKVPSIPEIYTGLEGFDVSFAPESIPSSVTAGSSVDVVLLLNNKGAADMPAAIIAVKDTKGAFTLEDAKGSDKFDFLKPLIKLKKVLSGKETSSNNLEGVTLTLKAKPFSTDKTTGKVVQDFVDTGLLATNCYDYSTKLTANICVDASTYSFQKQRKPCDYKVPLTFAKGQGAPVSVTRIETLDPDTSGNTIKPRFKIYIANSGKGLIIDKSSLNLFCAPSGKTSGGSKDDTPKVNAISIDKVQLNGKDLKCSEAGKILSGIPSKDYVLCYYDGTEFAAGSGAFVTPLSIEFSYGYTVTTTPLPVRVERGVS